MPSEPLSKTNTKPKVQPFTKFEQQVFSILMNSTGKPLTPVKKCQQLHSSTVYDTHFRLALVGNSISLTN